MYCHEFSGLFEPPRPAEAGAFELGIALAVSSSDIEQSFQVLKVFSVSLAKQVCSRKYLRTAAATMTSEGPMSEDAQMRLKKGATKGGLTRSDGSKPEPEDEDVQKKGGMSKDAQERLIEGARKGGRKRAEQLGREGYQEMGRKGGLSTMEKSGEEAAKEKGIKIDESKYKTHAPLSEVAKKPGEDDEENEDENENQEEKEGEAKLKVEEEEDEEYEEENKEKPQRKAQTN